MCKYVLNQITDINNIIKNVCQVMPEPFSTVMEMLNNRNSRQIKVILCFDTNIIR